MMEIKTVSELSAKKKETTTSGLFDQVRDQLFVI